MADIKYKLDLVSAVRYVAAKLDGAAPVALSALASDFRHPQSDLNRIRANERTDDPEIWLIRHVIDELGDQVVIDDDRVSLAQGLRIADLRWNGREIHPVEQGERIEVNDSVLPLAKRRVIRNRVRSLMATVEKGLTKLSFSDDVITEIFRLYTDESDPADSEMDAVLFVNPAEVTAVTVKQQSGGQQRTQPIRPKGKIPHFVKEYMEKTQEGELVRPQKIADAFNDTYPPDPGQGIVKSGVIDQALTKMALKGSAKKFQPPTVEFVSWTYTGKALF